MKMKNPLIDSIEMRLIAIETTLRFMKDRFGSENENKIRSNKVCFNWDCQALHPCGCIQNLAEICKYAIKGPNTRKP